MSLNVGQVIEHIVRSENVGVSELSRKLKVSRRTVYNWFSQKTLSLDIICKIGSVIKHDFSKEFPDDFERLNAENNNNDYSGNETNTDESHSSPVSYWMSKYIKLLEKYNELLSHEFSSTASHEKKTDGSNSPPNKNLNS